MCNLARGRVTPPVMLLLLPRRPTPTPTPSPLPLPISHNHPFSPPISPLSPRFLFLASLSTRCLLFSIHSMSSLLLIPLFSSLQAITSPACPFLPCLPVFVPSLSHPPVFFPTLLCLHTSFLSLSHPPVFVPFRLVFVHLFSSRNPLSTYFASPFFLPSFPFSSLPLSFSPAAI